MAHFWSKIAIFGLFLDFFDIKWQIYLKKGGQVDDSRFHSSILVARLDENISEGYNIILGSKKAHFGSKMCFFGLFGNIRAKISKVNRCFSG